MNRRVGTTTLSASLGGLATATALILILTSPSEATPDTPLDAAAVDTAVLDAAVTLIPAAEPGTPPPAAADGVGAFDPVIATWHLRTLGGDPKVFVFGERGSTPLVGDWDGDGVDTVGVYDTLTATVSLRNANTPGDPNESYQVGLPGDALIAADFDGDGTDTVSVFRPSDRFVGSGDRRRHHQHARRRPGIRIHVRGGRTPRCSRRLDRGRSGHAGSVRRSNRNREPTLRECRWRSR